MGILFALLSAVFQGFGFVSLKKSYRHLKPSLGYAMDAGWGLLLWIPFALLSGISFSQVPQVLPYAILSALFSEAFVFFALSRGEISLTGTLFATYPIYTILFSHFINHEILNYIQWITIFFVIFGTVLITLPTRIKQADLRQLSNLLWPLAAAMAVGISDTLSKHVIDQTNAATFLFCLGLAQIPVAAGYLYIEYRKHSSALLNAAASLFSSPAIYKYAVIGSLCNVLCVLCLWISFGTTLASIAAPLTASYPLYLVIFAKILLKEKIHPRNWTGIALILENTMLLMLTTSTSK